MARGQNPEQRLAAALALAQRDSEAAIAELERLRQEGFDPARQELLGWYGGKVMAALEVRDANAAGEYVLKCEELDEERVEHARSQRDVPGEFAALVGLATTRVNMAKMIQEEEGIQETLEAALEAVRDARVVLGDASGEEEVLRLEELIREEAAARGVHVRGAPGVTASGRGWGFVPKEDEEVEDADSGGGEEELGSGRLVPLGDAPRGGWSSTQSSPSDLIGANPRASSPVEQVASGAAVVAGAAGWLVAQARKLQGTAAGGLVDKVVGRAVELGRSVVPATKKAAASAIPVAKGVAKKGKWLTPQGAAIGVGIAVVTGAGVWWAKKRKKEATAGMRAEVRAARERRAIHAPTLKRKTRPMTDVLTHLPALNPDLPALTPEEVRDYGVGAGLIQAQRAEVERLKQQLRQGSGEQGTELKGLRAEVERVKRQQPQERRVVDELLARLGSTDGKLETEHKPPVEAQPEEMADPEQPEDVPGGPLYGWEEVGSKGKLGPLTLEAGGAFSYSGMAFSQKSSLRGVRFGAATVEKAPGEGEVLLVRTPDAVHELRYVRGRWYYRRGS